MSAKGVMFSRLCRLDVYRRRASTGASISSSDRLSVSSTPSARRNPRIASGSPRSSAARAVFRRVRGAGPAGSRRALQRHRRWRPRRAESDAPVRRYSAIRLRAPVRVPPRFACLLPRRRGLPPTRRRRGRRAPSRFVLVAAGLDAARRRARVVVPLERGARCFSVRLRVSAARRAVLGFANASRLRLAARGRTLGERLRSSRGVAFASSSRASPASRALSPRSTRTSSSGS